MPLVPPRHAPRERVSWNRRFLNEDVLEERHAPRERVSWNSRFHHETTRQLVTLHVSVWVEIYYQPWAMGIYRSRSTWACELKSEDYCKGRHCKLSRSTWACELKFSMGTIRVHPSRHAPRERVSWNWYLWISLMTPLRSRSTWACELKSFWDRGIEEDGNVTLHVSVWVEIATVALIILILKSSRSTWACELK